MDAADIEEAQEQLEDLRNSTRDGVWATAEASDACAPRSDAGHGASDAGRSTRARALRDTTSFSCWGQEFRLRCA